MAHISAPGPDGVATVDELVARLRELRAWAGVSYRDLHRRLTRRRRSQGIAEEPAYATVYRCLQPGRSRLDIDLLVDIVHVLVDDEAQADLWRKAYARLHRETAVAHASVLGSLPDDVDVFTGREPELGAMADLVKDAAPRVLAIEGMAGVGKTTLAVHAAHGLIDAGHYADLQLSVNLHGHDPEREPAEPQAVLDGFLRRLGEPGPRIQAMDLERRASRYRELLAGRNALVLLDNAASEDQVRPLLPGSRGVLTIVTSRQRVIYDGARNLGLEVLSPEQAMDLLRHRVGAQTIDPESRTALRLVDQVGHLPLAVSLLASRVLASAGWTLQDHLEHLTERRQTLRLDTGVELAFTTSYEALTPPLRRMLRLLALHPGRDCDAYAAAAIADVDLDTATRQIATLADSRLARERSSRRYELHDLVRIFALNRAHEEDPSSARRTALTRLFDHYRWAAANAMDVYAPAERTRRPLVPNSDTTLASITDRRDAAEWLEVERSNLLAITNHAASHGWPDHVTSLSAILAPYLLNTAQFDTAEVLHAHASRHATGASRGVAFKDLASALWQRGDRHQAREMLKEALIIAEAHRDWQTQSRALMNLAVVHRHMGLYTEAIDANLRAIELFRKLGDRAGEGRVLGNLGIIYTVLGRLDESMEHLRRALRLASELRDKEAETRNLENRSSLYNRLGRFSDARRTAEASVALARQLGGRIGESEALVSLGVALSGLGDLGSAVDRQQEALDIAEGIGSSQCMINAHNALGSTLLSLGRLDDAAIHHRAALDIANDLEDPLNQAKAHNGLLHASAALGDRDNALIHGHAALVHYKQLGLPEEADNVAMYLNPTPRVPKS